MRRKTLTFSMLVLVIISLTGSLIQFSCGSNQRLFYILNDQEIVRPYTWEEFFGDKEIMEKIPLRNENLHPLFLGLTVLSTLRDAYNSHDESKLRLAKEYLDFLAYSYPLTSSNSNYITWKYPFKWNELEPGWWSGMANSAIALSFLVGYQVLGEEGYKSIAEKAINGVILPVEECGSTIWLDKKSCWFSEYVWNGISSRNEYFVLNGFLFSLLTVRIFADITRNERYLSMYEYGLNALKKMAPEFYYKGKLWTYYMLNPMTIDPPHYAIYEMVLYDALYKLTKEKFFFKELQIRRDILKENYHLHTYQDENKSLKLLFSLIGPPHPYWIDTYGIRIEFLSKKGEILEIKEIRAPRNLDIPIIDRSFIIIPYSKEISKYIVYSSYNGNIFKWYESSIESPYQKDFQLNPEIKNINLKCAYDAEHGQENIIIIKPPKITMAKLPEHYTNHQGRLILQLSIPINKRDYKYFGLSIKPTRDVKSLKIAIFDINGRQSSRYYIPLKRNVHNFILLQWLGFPNIVELSDEISELHITIYTSEYLSLGVEEFTMELGDLLVFKNEIAVYNYLKNSTCYFPEQSKSR